MQLPIPAPLQPFVEHIWTLAAQHGSAPQPVIADGAVDLIVRLGAAVLPLDPTPLASRIRHGEAQAYVLGPRLLPVFVQLMPDTLLVGIRFRPGGAFPFFGTALADLTDCAIGLGEFWRPHSLPALAEKISDMPPSAAIAPRFRPPSGDQSSGAAPARPA